MLAYEEGVYRIAVGPDRKLAYTAPAPTNDAANSVTIEVDVRKSGEQGLVGVFCNGNQGGDHFYSFNFDVDGFWGIGRVKAGQPTILEQAGEPSPLIKTGGGVNHLRAACSPGEGGDSVILSLAINGERVARVEDEGGFFGAEFSTPGFFLETTEAGDLTVDYDNFVLTAYPPEVLGEDL